MKTVQQPSAKKVSLLSATYKQPLDLQCCQKWLRATVLDWSYLLRLSAIHLRDLVALRLPTNENVVRARFSAIWSTANVHHVDKELWPTSTSA